MLARQAGLEKRKTGTIEVLIDHHYLFIGAIILILNDPHFFT